MDFKKVKDCPSGNRGVLKAQKAWSALTQAAINEEKLTYQELGDLIQHPFRRLMPIIAYIGRFCYIHEFPYLPVLCVRKDTGWPGGGFENPEQDTEEVYAFPWEDYPIPTIEQFRAAYAQYKLEKELEDLI